MVEAALRRADDLRRGERWQEELLVLKKASTHLADANSPALEERLRQAQSDALLATDLERVRESRPFQTDTQAPRR